MKAIGIYPGRFHPFHKGHAASFKQLAQKFGLDNTYLAISSKQEQPKSPFSAKDRASMAASLGIPQKNILVVSNPYKVDEYINKLQLDPDHTVLVFGVSKKDMEGDKELGIPPDPRFSFQPKKDGTPSYLQPYQKNLQPLSKHGYVMSTDVAEFPIAGQQMRDASAIRKAYAGANDKTKLKILTDLYGDKAKDMKQIFDNNLVITEGVVNLINRIKENIPTATYEQKKKFVTLLKEAKQTLVEANTSPGWKLDIIKKFEDGYVLVYDIYEDEDVRKDDFSIYKKVGDDEYRYVGDLRVSPYEGNRKPGDIEREANRLISQDKNLDEAKDDGKTSKTRWAVTDKDHDGEPEVKLQRNGSHPGSVVNKRLLAQARNLYPNAKNDIEAVFHLFGVKFKEMEETIQQMQQQIDELTASPEPAAPEATPPAAEPAPAQAPAMPPAPAAVKESKKSRIDYLSEK